MTYIDERPKPCLALMGEFSAGKSTLANLLIGSDPLPVQVVATQLPPVCISYGSAPAYAVDLEGNETPVDVNDLSGIDLDTVSYLQIYCEEDILLQCDLLDMPGISDPNMSSEVWERLIDRADGVLWCSHATQAWRQSEAAVWSDMPSELYSRSLLLLTRIDKLTTQSDKDRVLKRVTKETEGLFADVLPISLLLATQEQDDYDAWAQSGAEAFATRLIALLASLNAEVVGQQAPGAEDGLRLPGLEAPVSSTPSAALPTRPSSAPRVVPRRIQADAPRTIRPDS